MWTYDDYNISILYDNNLKNDKQSAKEKQKNKCKEKSKTFYLLVEIYIITRCIFNVYHVPKKNWLENYIMFKRDENKL